jgi:hypothetical protein
MIERIGVVPRSGKSEAVFMRAQARPQAAFLTELPMRNAS